MKKQIFTGTWGDSHIQGIAVDEKKGFIYYSFTTKLVKATLNGEIVGYVDGLAGHLGCIAFNERDGKVYGSLEYKNDVIGQDIVKVLKRNSAVKDSFYIAIFDVDKIDRMDMSAERDGVMRCVYLREVVEDYHGEGLNRLGKTVPHKYGCSGIDGTTFAPLPNKRAEDGMYLYVAYGVYSDIDRDDNDHQVILCYDISDWDSYAQPLDQDNIHTSGPSAPLHKFFVYTGNTTFGVQNLEYDSYKNAVFMAVYNGKKEKFPNYSLMALDMSAPVEVGELEGLGETGEKLSLLKLGESSKGIWGWNFPYGSMGLASLGGGRWMITHPSTQNGEQCANIHSYRWDDASAFVLEE